MGQEQLWTPQDVPFTEIIGIDEAGRGPLAGPVSAAAVLLPSGFPLVLLNDSKKMTRAAREKAEKEIKEKAWWAVGWASNVEIDRINILQATMLAMTRALTKLLSQDLPAEPRLVLVDGNRTPSPLPLPAKAVVKGDARIPQIMAASILAKEARDRLMIRAAKAWPQYGFEIHKGYPTKLHREMIARYGVCPLHRLTFTLQKKEESGGSPSLL